ncbi:MAG TPA: WhiB family transcriptional regulator [Nocardioidaceae bacterium]|jgi:hypothetical protein
MTNSRNPQGSGAAAVDGIPTACAQWWAALFQPTCALTEQQKHELSKTRARGWHRQALCAQADPEAWFPKQYVIPKRQVYRICAACPVRRSCLATALLYREQGIWAGTTVQYRRELYRQLRDGAPVDEVLDTALDQARRPSSEEAETQAVGAAAA